MNPPLAPAQMMRPEPDDDLSAIPSSRILLSVWGLIALAILIGVYSITANLAAQEKVHVTHQLSMLAGNATNQLSDKLSSHQSTLEQVAANVSVQMYLTQINDSDSAMIAAMPERDYLQNLMIATAVKGGFKAAVSDDGSVRASLPQQPGSALALIDASGRMVVSTRGMIPLSGVLESFLAGAPQDRASMLGPVALSKDVVAVLMQAPIYRVQAEASADARIGRVVGVRVLDVPLMASVFEAPKGAEILVVARKNSSVLSLRDGNVMLLNAAISKGTVIDEALEKSVQVVEGIRDNKTSAMATAVDVAGSDGLAIVASYDTAEAFAELNARSTWIWAVTLLALAGITAFLWALLRHSVSVRAAASAKHYQALAEKLDTKTRLLSLVTDTTPNAITILDDEQRICFTNWPRVHGLEMSADDLLQGKPVSLMMGVDVAARLKPRAMEALESTNIVQAIETVERSEGNRVLQCLYIPLGNIPIDLPFLTPASRGVLVIEEDITALSEMRAQQEQTLRRVVDCLVGFVDARDPYAAEHSLHVAALAREVAATMQLEETLVDTCEMAGKLLNIGKMHVPEDVLSQSGKLDATALQKIREAIASSAAVIDGIHFSGPVADTIRQSLERMDGAGPLGLAGERILLSARIVSAVNAYIGMISARAYRAPLSPEQAVQYLMQAAGSAYDAQVVAALVHYLSQQHG